MVRRVGAAAALRKRSRRDRFDGGAVTALAEVAVVGVEFQQARVTVVVHRFRSCATEIANVTDISVSVIAPNDRSQVHKRRKGIGNDMLFTSATLASAVLAIARWLAGWLAGWLLYAGIVSKRLNLS